MLANINVCVSSIRMCMHKNDSILNYVTHESCTSTTILQMISFHIEQSISCTLYIMTNIRYSVIAQYCPQILQRHNPVKRKKITKASNMRAQCWRSQTEQNGNRQTERYTCFYTGRSVCQNTYRLTESCKVLTKKEFSFYTNHHHLVKAQNQLRTSEYPCSITEVLCSNG